MKNFTYKSKYCTYKDCYFKVSRYDSTNNIAIIIMNNEEGVIASVTVSTNVKLPDDRIAVRDYPGNTGMADFMIELGVINSCPLHEIIISDGVDIPVYKLTELGKSIIEEGLE